jgi:tetratricopeptide (TPR) repeat protein
MASGRGQGQAQSAKPLNVARAITHAFEYHRQGRLPQAAQAYADILAVKPDHVDALHMLGVIKLQSGELAEALRLMAAALKAKPKSPDVLINHGLALNSLGRHDEALASFEAVIAIKPNSAEAYNNRGSVLGKLGRSGEALESYERALALKRDYAEAHFNRSNLLMQLKRFEEALAAAERALALRPNYMKAYNNRANLLNALGRHEEALASAGRAQALDPKFSDAHYNAGNALARLGRHEEALDAFDRALTLNPNHAEAQWNAALARLRLGDLRNGLKQYEWRWRQGDAAKARRSFPQPQWRGEPLAGKTLLLHAEQGLGDTIQLVRYVPLLAAQGARVIVEVQPALKSLLADFAGAAQVIAFGESLPPFDLYCPMLSLPAAFGTDLDTVPAKIPYLAADEERIAEWRGRLPAQPGLRVGLVWSGNPTHQNDRHRSIPLAQLACLLDVPETNFVSLQKDVREEDAAVLADAPRVAPIGGGLRDFRDTAAVIALLDLVIAVDTSVAHLAGAMGKPVWVLVPFCPDWRWMLERADSPWYPSARLFRQPAIGDWQRAISQVRAALAELPRKP